MDVSCGCMEVCLECNSSREWSIELIFLQLKKNIFGDFSLNILITFAITKMNIIYFIVIFVTGQGSPSLCNEVSIEYI